MNFNWRTEVIRADPEWPYFSRNVIQFEMSNGRRFWDRIVPGEPYPWVDDALTTIEDTRSKPINQMTDRPIEDWHP